MLLDEAFFTRVRAVEQMPTALDRAAASAALRQAIEAPPLSLVGGHEMRVIHESGAAWGGMEPVDPGDDLDGPAGDERAPGLTEAGAAAAGWAVDVAKLRLAWETLKTAANDDITARAEATIDDIIDALALRAGQLRPSRLAGGQ